MQVSDERKIVYPKGELGYDALYRGDSIMAAERKLRDIIQSLGGMPFLSTINTKRKKKGFKLVSSGLKAALWKFDARCHYCQELLDYRDCTVEHRIPICRGGTDDPGNLALTCDRCNKHKGWLTEEEYLQVLSWKTM